MKSYSYRYDRVFPKLKFALSSSTGAYQSCELLMSSKLTASFSIRFPVLLVPCDNPRYCKTGAFFIIVDFHLHETYDPFRVTDLTAPYKAHPTQRDNKTLSNSAMRFDFIRWLRLESALDPSNDPISWVRSVRFATKPDPQFHARQRRLPNELKLSQ